MSNSNLTDMQSIGVNAELSAYEEGARKNNELLLRLQESRKAVEEEALRIIDAMSLAFDQKNESIEAMRSWRKSIVMEATQATNAANALIKNLTAERIAQLREFVELVERLNKVEPGIIVGKLFSDGEGLAAKGHES